jgi:hypothetical protein
MARRLLSVHSGTIYAGDIDEAVKRSAKQRRLCPARDVRCGSTGFCWLREKFSAQANIEVRTIDLEQPIIACGLIMRCSISYSAFLCSVVLGRRFAADIPRAWLLIINGLQSSNTPKEQHGEL